MKLTTNNFSSEARFVLAAAATGVVGESRTICEANVQSYPEVEFYIPVTADAAIGNGIKIAVDLLDFKEQLIQSEIYDYFATNNDPNDVEYIDSTELDLKIERGVGDANNPSSVRVRAWNQIGNNPSYLDLTGDEWITIYQPKLNPTQKMVSEQANDCSSEARFVLAAAATGVVGESRTICEANVQSYPEVEFYIPVTADAAIGNGIKIAVDLLDFKEQLIQSEIYDYFATNNDPNDVEYIDSTELNLKIEHGVGDANKPSFVRVRAWNQIGNNPSYLDLTDEWIAIYQPKLNPEQQMVSEQAVNRNHSGFFTISEPHSIEPESGENPKICR